MHVVLIICNGCITKNEEVGNRGAKHDYIIIYSSLCLGIGGHPVPAFLRDSPPYKCSLVRLQMRGISRVDAHERTGECVFGNCKEAFEGLVLQYNPVVTSEEKK